MIAPANANASPQRDETRELRAYLERLPDYRDGHAAARIALSALRAANRRERHRRAAAERFDGLVGGLRAHLFELDNDDLLVFHANDAAPLMETEIARLKHFFAEDPLFGDESDSAFVTRYDLAADYDAFLAMIARLQPDVLPPLRARARRDTDARTRLRARQSHGEVLNPELLARLESALARTDVSTLIRRGPVVRIAADDKPAEVLFSEVTVSIAELTSAVLPRFDLAANHALFQYLTETLDRRVLAMMLKPDQQTSTRPISINLNVATLIADDFLAFEEKLYAARRGSIMIELKIDDIFANLEIFLVARQFAQQRGYPIGVDGLTHRTLPLVDRHRLGCDFLKVKFDAAMLHEGPSMRDVLAAAVARNGRDRLILSHVEGPQALRFGRSAGIELFQGYHTERLIHDGPRRRAVVPAGLRAKLGR